MKCVSVVPAPDLVRTGEVIYEGVVQIRSLLALSFVAFVMVAAAPQQKRFEDCSKTARTQRELTTCAGNDYKSADDELNRTYQQLLKKAAGDPVAVQKIRAAQTAWVAFSDAHVAALYPDADKMKEYGSIFPMCVSLALSDLTRQRTRMLKAMLNPVEGEACAGVAPAAGLLPATPREM